MKPRKPQLHHWLAKPVKPVIKDVCCVNQNTGVFPTRQVPDQCSGFFLFYTCTTIQVFLDVKLTVTMKKITFFELKLNVCILLMKQPC